jgi:hypothetical protein
LSTDAQTNNVANALRLLHATGSVFEIRVLGLQGGGRPHAAAGWFNDHDAAAKAVENISRQKPEGVYVTLNECDPRIMARSPGVIRPHQQPTTSDNDIIRRRWILLDFDPKRPAGISSTEEELQAARNTASDCREWLINEHLAFGESPPVLAESGNGVHLLISINMPNDDEAKKDVEGFLKAVAARFDSETITVDKSVFNAARITKLYGTIARKGADTPERPHRISKIIA